MTKILAVSKHADFCLITTVKSIRYLQKYKRKTNDKLCTKEMLQTTRGSRSNDYSFRTTARNLSIRDSYGKS